MASFPAMTSSVAPFDSVHAMDFASSDRVFLFVLMLPISLAISINSGFHKVSSAISLDSFLFVLAGLTCLSCMFCFLVLDARIIPQCDSRFLVAHSM